MKILKLIIQSALLLFFYTIIYSVLSFFLDKMFYLTEGYPSSKYGHSFIEYIVYFLVYYGIYFLVLFFLYRNYVMSIKQSLLARMLIGAFSGFIIGMILMRINVSFYIGYYRSFKTVALFTVLGAFISLIDFYLFKNPSSPDNEN